MIIYTAVWGEKYTDWFNRGLKKSFEWTENKKIVDYAKWIVDDSMSWQSLVQAAKMSYDEKRPFLLAPPDNVFSDGSLSNWLKIANLGEGLAIATPHVRALPSYLDKSDKHRTPREMVKHAWNHLHDSWKYSRNGSVPSVTRDGGVLWEELAPGLIAVQHYLPTVFLTNLTKRDIEFFEWQQGIFTWDNLWPPRVLIPDKRYRYIGSSDIGFVVEITDHDKNVPKFGDGSVYKGTDTHHAFNKQIIGVFRLETEANSS